MKIYFGRKPNIKNPVMIDNHFLNFLEDTNYNFELAVERLLNYLTNIDAIAYTCNCLIINYLDEEFSKKNVYFITKEGEEILMGNDASMLKKLPFMGVGEALVDDARVFD